ncbi:MAG: NUDIX hydrolase [Candidatus Eisenbacteria bacterium]|nr:NUDIX hydrolase [Candidatus Eisenbacteria bacterium]
MRRWERLSNEVFFRSPWVSFEHDRYRLPDGVEGDYFYVRSAGAVMVVPIDREGGVHLVRQYRYLLDEDSLEFPAGGMRGGVDPVEQARAELREEAGFEAGEWEPLGRFASWNGVTNEICHVFLARDLAPAAGEPDTTEEFERIRVTWEELLRMAETNEIFDGMTLASIALARRVVEGERGRAEG